MDVVLGAAVTGPVARLALVDGSATERRDVIDQSTVDVESDPVRKLAAAIVGTQRLLIEDGHRLAGTRVCWSDDRGLQQLRQTLSAAGISDITPVPESDAAVAMVRDISRVAGTASGNGPGHAALLFCDDDTATLSIVGADDATTAVVGAEHVEGSDPVAACRTLLSRLREQPGETQNLFLMSTSSNIAEVAKQIRTESPVPLVIPDDTDLAFAHGATLAGGTARSTDGIWTETALNTMGAEATALSPQIGPQLAYSAVDDSGSLPPLSNAGNHDLGGIPIQSRMSPLSQADDDDEEDDTVATGAAAVRPRYLLLGSGVAAAVVVAFAALAVTVAAGIRPDPSKVALAQPQSHPMPTFLPLPTNVAPPPLLNPDAVPAAAPQAAPVPGIGGGQLPGGSGTLAGGPVELPQGAPPPADTPDAAPSPQSPSWGMPGVLPIPVIVPIPGGGGFGGTGPIWVMNPTTGQLELKNWEGRLPGREKDTLPGPGAGTPPSTNKGTLPGREKDTLPGPGAGTPPGAPPGGVIPHQVDPPPPVQVPHVDPPVQVPAQPPVVPPPAQPPVVPPPAQPPVVPPQPKWEPPPVAPPPAQPPVVPPQPKWEPPPVAPPPAQPPVVPPQPKWEPPAEQPPQPPVYHPPQPPVYQPPAPQIPSPPIWSPPPIQIPMVPMNPSMPLFPRGHR